MQAVGNHIDLSYEKPFLLCIAVLLIANAIIYFSGAAALALPVTGTPALVSPNDVTIPVTGAVGETTILWGQNPTGYVWNTPNGTPVAGNVDINITGAPILGGTKYYAVACDTTGCGNEVSFTTLPITPITVVPYGAGYRNITATRWNLILIGATLFKAYTTVMPASLVWGLLFGGIVIGTWFRTKSVRLISIVMMIASPFIVLSNAGLMLGIPLAEQSLGQVLLAAGFAGMMLSFIKP
jgi:hypothetical protein